MPVYEYKCTKCDKQFEVTQKITDNPLTECTSCGGELKKLITSTSFVLKGGGWYITDYPSPDRKKALEAKKKSNKEKKPGKKAEKETGKMTDAPQKADFAQTK
jgi:putative FmdB family regulatory protein